MAFEFQNVPPSTLLSPLEVFLRNDFNGVSDSTNAISAFSGRIDASGAETTIYLTYDGTDTGAPLFAGVPFAVITAQLTDPNSSIAPYAFIKSITNTELVVGLLATSTYPVTAETDVQLSFFVIGNKTS